MAREEGLLTLAPLSCCVCGSRVSNKSGWIYVRGPEAYRESLWIVCRKVHLEEGTALRQKAALELLSKMREDHAR